MTLKSGWGGEGEPRRSIRGGVGNTVKIQKVVT